MKNQMIGRLVSALSASALAVSGMGSLPLADVHAASLTGQDAKGIVSKMTIGWNLGNTLDSTADKLSSTSAPGKFAKAWGNPEPTAELFQTVKDGGFNTVRIPTTWYQHLEWDESSKMYLVNDTWMDYVKSTVDFAIDRDMFVILNVHHENWVNVDVFTDDTYKDAEKKLTDIWTQVAEEFKDYDQHLIFEGMNEPRQVNNPDVNQWGNGTEDGGYTSNYINKLNAAFVKTVRANKSAANQERLLMLPGYCASSDPKSIRAIEIPANAGNVALSVHAYAPYYFTMATDEKANHSFPGKSGWGEDYEGALTNMFNEFGKIQQEKNAPIILGEFSASDFDNTEDRCRWAESYLSKAKEQGIPCVLWDNNVVDRSDGEAHGYVYRATNTWYPKSKPVVETMMKVYGITPTLPDYKELEKPTFKWSDFDLTGAEEIFKSEKGTALKVWGNTPIEIENWKDFIGNGYDLVLLYDSESEPELVLQGDNKIWDRVQSSDESETPFKRIFTYDDIKAALENYGNTMDDMTTLYISATGKTMTAYGLYAVSKGNPIDPTQGPTEATKATEATEPTKATEPTTKPTEPTEPKATKEVTIKYEDLKDSKSGKTIPIDDPANLKEIIIDVTSDCSSESPDWYCGGGAICFNDLIDAETGEKTWGFKEFQWNKGDKKVVVKFDNKYRKPDPDKENANLPLTSSLTVKSGEMQHWWVSSSETDDGSDVSFTYNSITLVYNTDATDPTEATKPTQNDDLPQPTDATKPTESKTDITYGDLNGDKVVDILDLIRFNKFLLGTLDLNADEQKAADANADGKVTSDDALNVLKLITGTIKSLPVTK
jgi:aryl-phospho-beta-D-glucosidase BglC (GH1 family)